MSDSRFEQRVQAPLGWTDLFVPNTGYRNKSGDPLCSLSQLNQRLKIHNIQFAASSRSQASVPARIRQSRDAFIVQ